MATRIEMSNCSDMRGLSGSVSTVSRRIRLVGGSGGLRAGLEIYAAFRTGRSQAFLARFRTWIDVHTDQVIIAGSLILGFWLLGKSIYLIVT